jgi:uncharacterized membrane protein
MVENWLKLISAIVLMLPIFACLTNHLIGNVVAIAWAIIMGFVVSQYSEENCELKKKLKGR